MADVFKGFAVVGWCCIAVWGIVFVWGDSEPVLHMVDQARHAAQEEAPR